MEEEIQILTIQSDKLGKAFRVNIPKREVVIPLKIFRGQKVRVLLERTRGRIIYELMPDVRNSPRGP